MSYFDNNIQIAAYFVAYIVAFFAYYLAILLTKKYRERRNDILRILTIMVWILATAVFVDPFLFTIYRLNGLQGTLFDYAVSIQTHLSFGLAGIANVFLIVFLVKVFLQGRYHWGLYAIAIFQLSVLPIGLYMAITEQDTLPLLIAFIGSSLVIFCGQVIWAWKLSRKSDVKADPVASHGLKYIGLSGVLLLATYISFTLQQAAGEIPEFAMIGLIQGQNSIFIPLGWILAGLEVFCLYVGYVTPNWMKKRWQKTE